MSGERRVPLWEAIGAYVRTCGGDDGEATVSNARMDAVTGVERALEQVVEERLAEERGARLLGGDDGKPWPEQLFWRAAHVALQGDAGEVCSLRLEYSHPSGSVGLQVSYFKTSAPRQTPSITIEGVQLTPAQATAVRVAVNHYSGELAKLGALGVDVMGEKIRVGYRRRLAEVLALMNCENGPRP